MSTSGDVSREQQEARVIDRRRRLEEERKARIFNAKQRTIGVDRWDPPSLQRHAFAHAKPCACMRRVLAPLIETFGTRRVV